MLASIVVIDPLKAIIAAAVVAFVGVCVFSVRHILRRRGEKGERR